MSEFEQPLLSLWRSASHRKFVERVDDILAILGEITRFKGPAHQALMSEALALPRFGQGDRAWAVATKLAHRGHDESDLFMSWVAVAAMRHSAPAVIVLMQALAKRGNDRLSRRALISWLRFTHENLPNLSVGSGREQLIKQLAEVDTVAPTASTGIPHATDDIADRGPNLTVLGERDDRHDDTLERCRAILREPLPLRGAIGADDLHSALAAEFPWMSATVDRIAEDLALQRFLGGAWFRIRPLLIVGPPGAGKTRLARRLAELAEVPLVFVGAGGSSDNRSIQGTARGYSNTHPSLVLLAMANHCCANPLVVVDEIDKTSPGRLNGNVQDTLLGMLEPETARQWYDEALMAPADLTRVNWILCANDTASLQRPLLSRLAIVRVGLPSAKNFGTILSGILSDIAKEYGVDRHLLPPLEPEVMAAIRTRFRHGGSVRAVRGAVMRALGLRARAFLKTVN